ncbi:MAG TPA: hypothetical protein VMQ50_13870 [Casimicrobiaceae bacterium]|nr:hypothetical protein [Casimicrobiaceae bacterium]
MDKREAGVREENAGGGQALEQRYGREGDRKSRSRTRNLLAAALLAVSLQAGATDMHVEGSYYAFWQTTKPDIGYLFAGFLTRQPSPDVADQSTFTVGAQIGAGNAAGANQGVWGIATEAWAFPGSLSSLIGIEATTINMEPTNVLPKASFYATFKNRPDTRLEYPPADAMNANSQALRIEAQPGTGYERGIVFGPISMHASTKLARPVAVDFSEMDEAAVEGIDVMRFPDGCSVVYLGHGVLSTRCDK